MINSMMQYSLEDYADCQLTVGNSSSFQPWCH